MGDLRFERPYVRLVEAEDPAAEVRAMSDEDLIGALAAASGDRDPLLANVLATEAQNRARRARAIAEHVGEGIYAIDRAGRLTYLNPEAERLLGIASPQALGRDVAEIVWRVDDGGRRVERAAYPSIVSLEEGRTIKRAGTLLDRGAGRVLSVLCTAAPIRVEGDVTGAVVSVRDVTERREAEDALDLSHRLLEAAGEAILAIRPDGEIFYANLAAERLFRRRPDPLVGLEVREIFAGLPDVADAFSSRRDWSGEVDYRAGDRARRLHVALRRVEDDRGRLVALVALAVAVSNRPRTSEDGARLRRVLAGAPVILWATDADGIVTLSEGQALEKTGLQPGALVGRPFEEVVPGRPAAVRHLRRALAGEEFEIVAEFGGRQFETRYAPLVGDGGAVEGVIGLSFDVTERIETERALRESEERFRLVGRAAGDTIWDLDLGTGDVWRGEQFDEAFGHREVSGTAEAWETLVHPQDRDRVVAEVAHALADTTRDSSVFEYRFRRADGTYADVVDRAFILRREDGRPSRLVGVMVDVTSKRHEARHRELEERHRELEAFSYSVSHDIRARLRGIEFFTQVLLEEQGDRLDEEGRGYVRRVQQESARLNEFVQELLRFASVARGEVSRRPVDATALADAVVANLRGPEPSRPIEVVVERGLTIEADPGLLRVVLENIIGNAWKYTRRTPEPQILVAKETWPDGRPGLVVSDNGAGFDPALAARLFRPFERLHASTEFEGTGLGLATVARIVRRHGGDIRAEGAPGKGAAFRFTLAPTPSR